MKENRFLGSGPKMDFITFKIFQIKIGKFLTFEELN